MMVSRRDYLMVVKSVVVVQISFVALVFSAFVEPSPIKSPPVFKDGTFQTYVVQEGGKLKLRCAVHGNPKPTLMWYKDNALVPSNNKNIRMNRFHLTLSNVKINDAGTYSCHVHNNLGEKWKNFTVVVESKPTSLYPKTTSVPQTKIQRKLGAPVFTRPRYMEQKVIAKVAGKSVSIRCPAEGNPTPTITWLKDGQPPKRRLSQRVVMKKWSLFMEDLTVTDKGNYMCIISNIHGSINATFSLDVVERFPHRPVIQDQLLKNQTVYVGETTKFDCQFLSDPQPSMQWLRHVKINGTYITVQGVPSVDVIKTADDANPHVLEITNATLEDEGWYTCLVGNTYGISYSTVYLTVLPATPDNYTQSVKLEPQKVMKLEVWHLIIGFTVVILFLVLFIIAVFLLCKQKQKMRNVLIRNNQQIIKKVYIESPNSNVSDVMLTPLVKIDYANIERCGNNRSRLSSELTNLSEYEIPLDPKWEFSRSKLCLGKPLGEGAFGQVLKAESYGIDGNPDKITITAVKMLKDGYSDEELTNLVLEMEVMKVIGKHRNIINLLGCCTQDGPLYVITEYAQYGNLRDYLRSHRPSSGYERAISDTRPNPLTIKDLVSFARQVARGMEYLSSRKCIHRDLAARNVLVAENKEIKIADFGLARDVHNINYYKKTTDGRLPVKWMAPEALFDRLYTTQSDVWSYGVLLWEIITLGGTPYPSVPVEKLFQLLKDGHRMNRPPNCSMDIYTLMTNCWKSQPSQRPQFTEVVVELDSILTTSFTQEYLELTVPQFIVAGAPSSLSSMDTDLSSEDEDNVNKFL
ncbi:FGFR4 (predicted) [Pycnogonum litorale]